MAHIEIIIGPMFSGKSTELIRLCNNYESINKNVLIFNHSFDSRNENDVVQSHSKSTKRAIKTHSLVEYLTNNKTEISMYNVIAIDEAQFFRDLLMFVKQIEHLNIVVLIAGLDGDCHRVPFGEILQCIPYANSVTKLNAFCMVKKDGTKAAFTKRHQNIDPQQTQIDIGAQDKYYAVCRDVYLNNAD